MRHAPYTIRNVNNFPIFKLKHNFFKNLFSPSTISEWNKLDPNLRNSESFLTSKKNILHFVRPTANSVYNYHSPKEIKLITRLRLGLNRLREQKFKHNFQESLSPLCNWGDVIESTNHFLLHCPLFTNERYTILSTQQQCNVKQCRFCFNTNITF